MKYRKAYLLVATILIAISILYLEMMKPTTQQPNGPLKDGKFPLAPELAGISGYINTENITLASLRGKVVLIDFWTYTCINCIRTLPYLKQWDEKYRDKGLVIIGVHTPEFNFEKEHANVLEAVRREGILYPVVQDNNYATWAAFKNRYWPRKYLIDAQGYIRYDHIGEGAYEETEKVIQQLLAESGVDVDNEITSTDSSPSLLPRTPELYAGADYALPRGQDVGNPGGLKAHETADYILPLSRNRHVLYLQGKWESRGNELVSNETNASVFLDFSASSVNMVANGPIGAKIRIFLNGQPVAQNQAGKDISYDRGQSYIVLDSPRLYSLIIGEYGVYTLQLEMDAAIAVHAFTFG